MTAATYTTDLVTFNDCTSVVGFAEATGFNQINSSGEVDVDLAIYGDRCISEAQRKSGKGGLFYTTTEPASFVDGTDCYFVWFKFFAPNACLNKSVGGIQMFVGSSNANFNQYYVNGADTYSYGGWVNYVVNPNTATVTASATTGTPSGTHNGAGMGVDITYAIAKGNAFTIDIMRWGRGEVILEHGTAPDAVATFAGLAAVNDNATTGRWGLFQALGGSYLWKGLMSLGTATNALRLTDSNINITIDNTEYVQSDFNRVAISNASTVITWNSVNFTALGTVSKGELEMVDNATLTATSCNFSDMNTFIFQSNATLDSCAFIRCGQITHGGANMSNSTVSGYEGTVGTGAVTYNAAVDPDGEMDNMNFTKGTAATHAIQFGTSAPQTMTLRNITFSGYTNTIGNNDAPLFFPDTGTNVTWTVNLVGCTGIDANGYRKARVGDTVILVVDPVTVQVVTTIADGSALSGVQVILFATGTTKLPFPVKDSVTIVNSGTTATVTHTSHGMSVGDKVLIKGASIIANNGVHTIVSVPNANSYTYTMGSTPGASPTGTITSTFVALFGTTNGSGVLSASRVYSSDQLISGRAASASTSPLYKTAPINGTITSASGLSTSVVLISDE